MARENIDFGAPNWNVTINKSLEELYAGGGVTPT